MRSKPIASVICLCLLLTLVPPAFAYADELHAANLQPFQQSKTQQAGWLLSDVMDLINEQYAGAPVTTDELLEAALRGMTEILDPYSEYFSEEELEAFTGGLTGQLKGIGVMMNSDAEGNPYIQRVLSGTPAQEAGLLRGDKIKTVNSQSVEGLSVSEISALVTNPDISTATLGVLRGDKNLSFTMVKREIKSLTVFTDKLSDLLGPSVNAAQYRYISVTMVAENTAVDLKNAVAACKAAGVKGIVLDLRGNTGGYLDIAVDICRILVPEGAIYHQRDARGRRHSEYTFLKEKPFGKMVVLVDSHTASAAELIASALQDSGAALIIGETTYGKGVIQTLFSLPAGGALKLTNYEFFRRGGGALNGVGVTPDVIIEEMDYYVYETPEDTALIKALDYLLTGKY